MFHRLPERLEPRQGDLSRRALLGGLPLAAGAGALWLAAFGRDTGFGVSQGPQPAGHGGPWLNTRPLTEADLRGRVLLVNFWTYTCINSLRPLPYLRAWHERYRDRGLVVVGVHTPEFTFEHDLARVEGAVRDLGVGYPVTLDNDFALWRRFGNTAWPGFHLVDASGRVRHSTAGEGEYGLTEQRLQDLLAEASGAAVRDVIRPVTGSGLQAEADWVSLRSRETYLGRARAAGFASPGGLRPPASRYRAPARLPAGHWSLEGQWTAGREAVTAQAPGAALSFRFHARDLHLVLAPPVAGGALPRFRVSLDGGAPVADHGTDIDPEGRGRLGEARLYQLIRQSGPVRERTFRIEFAGPGASAYAFTFG